MHSQTKSFVSGAIGLLEEDGLLWLNDIIAQYFPEKIDCELPPYLSSLTIRDMLLMETCGEAERWFTHPTPYRTQLYFAFNSADHLSDKHWTYDSSGSQVLRTLVEKITGGLLSMA